MKNSIYIISILTFLISCTQKKQEKELKQVSETTELNSEPEKLKTNKNLDKTLAEWVEYYQGIDPNFKLSFFELKSVDSLQIMPGNVVGNFDKNFDPIYSDFLIYRADKKQYLDFDSYQWTLNEEKTPSFSPDQEINLVDIENKTVRRIAFRGPSRWVEDAIWENNTIIILLENTYEKQPMISRVLLDKKLVETYKYPDTLDSESKYSELKFKKKGIKYE